MLYIMSRSRGIPESALLAWSGRLDRESRIEYQKRFSALIHNERVPTLLSKRIFTILLLLLLAGPSSIEDITSLVQI